MMKRCFVVMGYGTRTNCSTGKKINLDKVYHDIIKPAVIESGYECLRGDEVLDSGLIDESMYYAILESDLVVADLTTLNPNAIYELGVRHGVRKFRTVIMMESNDKFFFDLNHNRTVTYTYYEKKKDFKLEANQVKERLKQIIQSIDKNIQVDSPLYKFISDLKEPIRLQAENVKAKDVKPLYQRIKEATALRNKQKYKEAYDRFESLSKDVPSDPYFRQQMALCTYKAKMPTAMEACQKAIGILKPISETVDPETNGLIGAIFKQKYNLTSNIEDLNVAIESYKKAYDLFQDYYPGENYAFALLLKSSAIEDAEEKKELFYVAKRVYREIYETNKDFAEEEINTEYEIWMLATLASCALILKYTELKDKYESLFYAKANQMMKTSYKEQKLKLLELLKRVK